MKRSIAVLFSLILIAVAGAAGSSAAQYSQSGCSLTAETAPAIRGVRLGMTPEQAVGLFSSSMKKNEIDEAIAKAKETGMHGMSMLTFPIPPANGEGASGSLGVSFKDGRVAIIAAQYLEPAWESVDQWINKLSESLKLPGPKGWTASTSENPGKVLKCNGIQIEAGIMGSGGSVIISTTTGMMHDHSSSSPDKSRQTFKP